MPTISQTDWQSVFMKDDFHYLNVSLVGKSTVYDAMDCAFECLSSPLCFSFNLATFRRAKGKFLCKVLSTDKYRTATQYGGNMSSHRFSTAVGILKCLDHSSFLEMLLSSVISSSCLSIYYTLQWMMHRKLLKDASFVVDRNTTMLMSSWLTTLLYTFISIY